MWLFSYRSQHLYTAWPPQDSPWKKLWQEAKCKEQNVTRLHDVFVSYIHIYMCVCAHLCVCVCVCRGCVSMCVCRYRAHRSDACGPSSGGSRFPAPRRQCCTIARLCNNSSLGIRQHMSSLSACVYMFKEFLNFLAAEFNIPLLYP